jgi:hypothetical protein
MSDDDHSRGEDGPFRNDLRSQLVTAGTGAAEQWLSTRANRRMSDVNRRRLAGHVVGALWEQIEQAAIGMAEHIASGQLAAANARAETAEAELRAEREREPEADLLYATGPTSIVLGVIRARHKSAGRDGWASRDRSMVIAGFDDPADRQFALHAHDDVAGLLGIVERAHRDLRIMFEEHLGLRARLDGLGEEWRFDDGMGKFTVSRLKLSPADIRHLGEITGHKVEHRLVGKWQDATEAADPDAAADGHSATETGDQT